MATVRCPTCHREERWAEQGGPRQVLVEGGMRRPAEHPTLAAWRVLRAAREARTGPVVAACPACGLPMVADDPKAAPLESWVLEAPEGRLVMGARLEGPQGEITLNEAEAWLERQLREGFRFAPVEWFFASLVAVLALGLFVLWLGAASNVVRFVLLGARGTAPF